MSETMYEETYETFDLKCPYCGEFISDSWEIDFNDDKIVIECQCGKKFYGRESIIRNYIGEANCELNNEKHDFENLFENSLKCKICGEIKLKEIKK